MVYSPYHSFRITMLKDFLLDSYKNGILYLFNSLIFRMKYFNLNNILYIGLAGLILSTKGVNPFVVEHL